MSGTVPWVVGLIGHPVGHSVSPLFQQAAFDALALPYRYEAWDTDPSELASIVGSLRHGARVGANVTVPYKQAVMPLLDQLTDEARAVGAVNVIVREADATLTGHNTDVQGFSDALREDGGFRVAGARVGVLGAGGAARAVVYALLRDGAAHILVHNRTPTRATELAADLDDGSSRLSLLDGDLDPEGAALRGCALLVNCASLGMARSPGESASYLTAAQIPRGILVCDIVANPARTPLMLAAESSGCRVRGGLAMLVRQGAAAFTLWTGQPAPLEAMFAAARAAMVSRT